MLTDFAIKIRDLVGGNNRLTYSDAVEDDPQRRRPDISVARKHLNWEPKVGFSNQFFPVCSLKING